MDEKTCAVQRAGGGDSVWQGGELHEPKVGTPSPMHTHGSASGSHG